MAKRAAYCLVLLGILAGSVSLAERMNLIAMSANLDGFDKVNSYLDSENKHGFDEIGATISARLKDIEIAAAMVDNLKAEVSSLMLLKFLFEESKEETCDFETATAIHTARVSSGVELLERPGNSTVNKFLNECCRRISLKCQYKLEGFLKQGIDRLSQIDAIRPLIRYLNQTFMDQYQDLFKGPHEIGFQSTGDQFYRGDAASFFIGKLFDASASEWLDREISEVKEFSNDFWKKIEMQEFVNTYNTYIWLPCVFYLPLTGHGVFSLATAIAPYQGGLEAFVEHQSSAFKLNYFRHMFCYRVMTPGNTTLEEIMWNVYQSKLTGIEMPM